MTRGGIGIFEHADHAEPRREHGYCTDDVARLLIVAVREPAESQAVLELGLTAFRFLTESQSVTGRTRNRQQHERSLAGPLRRRGLLGAQPLGVRHCGHRADDEGMRASTLSYFDHGAKRRSPASSLDGLRRPRCRRDRTARCPTHRRALTSLLTDAVTTIGPLSNNPAWPWPEPRLSYADTAYRKCSSLPAICSITPTSSTTGSRCCAGSSTVRRSMVRRSMVTCRRHPSTAPVARRCRRTVRSTADRGRRDSQHVRTGPGSDR